MAPVLNKIAEDNPDLVVMDVDVDELDNQDLITWAVTGIPTMFLFTDTGILLERFDGATPPVVIAARIAKAKENLSL
jgi:thiol-disulfide isomerase/thioredoxin